MRIYKITFPNGKVYIGQTTQTVEKRKDNYRQDAKTRNYGVYAAINKFGFKTLIFEEVEKCTLEKLDDRERFWISHYNSCNKQKGYNIESGGNKNKKLSEETKKQMSDNHYSKRPGFKWPKRKFTEEWKNNMRKPKNLTKEQRDAMRERTRLLKKGVKFSKSHKEAIAKSKLKKIDQYDKNGNFLKTWDSITEACNFYKTSAANIGEVLHNRQKTAKGFIWKLNKENV